jgi:hypothetical protein
MFKKQFTTISIATLATLGAFAMSVESASARPGGGFRGGGFHRAVAFRGGMHRPAFRHVHLHRHVHWRHRYHRWGFYRPAVYVGASYASACYFVRRPAGLFKVCPVY